MGKPLQLIGQKFGRLTVIEQDKEKIRKSIAWICKCECGQMISVRGATLKNGHTTSCGCSKYDRKYTPMEFNARSRYWYYRNELSFEDFMKISQQPCYWCGIPPSTISSVKNRGQLFIDNPFIWNGLDRIDNTKDHNKNNVVPCCWDCNIAHNDRTVDEFLRWAERLVTHQHKNKMVING
jgi:hypothetical protein